MSVYTKFGDKGRTSLYAGKIVSKASRRVNTYGTLDELNSFLGLVLADLKNKRLKSKIIAVQNDLFEIGASLANPATNKRKSLDEHLKLKVIEFEKEIDQLSKKLPSIENFILPGGVKAGASLHFARTLVRRAERRVVELAEKEKVSPQVIIYMNRLSDLLFMYARDVNHQEKKKEIIWTSKT